jgi:hypothetical protein
VPAIETLEKMARAMEIELYQLFFDANGKQPQDLKLPTGSAMKLSSKGAAIVSRRLGGYVPKMNDRDKAILVNLARKMAAR